MAFSNNRHAVLGVFVILSCCMIAQVWSCITLPPPVASKIVNIQVRKGESTNKHWKQAGTTTSNRYLRGMSSNFPSTDRYKFKMTAYVITGNIYVSIRGLYYIGGQQTYVKHAGNFVKLVGPSEAPTTTCSETLFRCEGQCVDCGACAWLFNNGPVSGTFRLEDPSNSAYRVGQLWHASQFKMTTSNVSPWYTFYDAISA